ncbi:uncharacterized protein LOC113200355 isoform X2 [Urocitellus parryii]
MTECTRRTDTFSTPDAWGSATGRILQLEDYIECTPFSIKSFCTWQFPSEETGLASKLQMLKYPNIGHGVFTGTEDNCRTPGIHCFPFKRIMIPVPSYASAHFIHDSSSAT